MKAVASAFIEIKTTKFTKKVQVDPYLEDALCSMCGVHHGPYYCREMSCFRYVFSIVLTYSNVRNCSFLVVLQVHLLEEPSNFID